MNYGGYWIFDLFPIMRSIDKLLASEAFPFHNSCLALAFQFTRMNICEALSLNGLVLSNL